MVRLTEAQLLTLVAMNMLRRAQPRDVALLRFPGRPPQRTATGIGKSLSALLSHKLLTWEPDTNTFLITERGSAALQAIADM